jgi:hypothetical protein
MLRVEQLLEMVEMTEFANALKLLAVVSNMCSISCEH